MNIVGRIFRGCQMIVTIEGDIKPEVRGSPFDANRVSVRSIVKELQKSDLQDQYLEKKIQEIVDTGTDSDNIDDRINTLVKAYARESNTLIETDDIEDGAITEAKLSTILRDSLGPEAIDERINAIVKAYAREVTTKIVNDDIEDNTITEEKLSSAFRDSIGSGSGGVETDLGNVVELTEEQANALATKTKLSRDDLSNLATLGDDQSLAIKSKLKVNRTWKGTVDPTIALYPGIVGDFYIKESEVAPKKTISLWRRSDTGWDMLPIEDAEAHTFCELGTDGVRFIVGAGDRDPKKLLYNNKKITADTVRKPTIQFKIDGVDTHGFIMINSAETELTIVLDTKNSLVITDLPDDIEVNGEDYLRVSEQSITGIIEGNTFAEAFRYSRVGSVASLPTDRPVSIQFRNPTKVSLFPTTVFESSEAFLSGVSNPNGNSLTGTAAEVVHTLYRAILTSTGVTVGARVDNHNINVTGPSFRIFRDDVETRGYILNYNDTLYLYIEGAGITFEELPPTITIDSVVYTLTRNQIGRNTQTYFGADDSSGAAVTIHYGGSPTFSPGDSPVISAEAGTSIRIDAGQSALEASDGTLYLQRKSVTDITLETVWQRSGAIWKDIISPQAVKVGNRDPNTVTTLGANVPIHAERLTGTDRYLLAGEGTGSHNPAAIVSQGNARLVDPTSFHTPGFRVTYINSRIIRDSFITITPLSTQLVVKGNYPDRDDLFPPTIYINGVEHIRESYSTVRRASFGSDNNNRINYVDSAAATYTPQSPVAIGETVDLHVGSVGRYFNIELITGDDSTVLAEEGSLGVEYFRLNTKQHYVHDGTKWIEAGNESRLFELISSINSSLGAHPEGLLDSVGSWSPDLLDTDITPEAQVGFVSGARVSDKNYALLSNRKVYEITSPSTSLFTLNTTLPGTPIGYTAGLMSVLTPTDEVDSTQDPVLQHFVIRKDMDNLYIDRYNADGSYGQSRQLIAPELYGDRADCFIEENTLHVLVQTGNVASSKINVYSFLFPQTLTHAPGTDDIHRSEIGGADWKEFGGCFFDDDKLYLSLQQSNEHYIVRPLTKRGGSTGSAWIAAREGTTILTNSDRVIPGFSAEGVGVIVWGDNTIFITRERAAQFKPIVGGLGDLIAENRIRLDTSNNKIEQLRTEVDGLLGALNAHSGVYQVDDSYRLQDFEIQNLDDTATTTDDFSSGAEFVQVVHRKGSATTERITACIKQGNKLYVRGEHNFSFSNFATPSNPLISFDQVRLSEDGNVGSYIVMYQSGLWATFNTSGVQVGSATFEAGIPTIPYSHATVKARAATTYHILEFASFVILQSVNGAREAIFAAYRFNDDRSGFTSTVNNLTTAQNHIIANFNISFNEDTKIASHRERLFITTPSGTGIDRHYTTSVFKTIYFSDGRISINTTPITTSALNTTIPVPSLQFTNEIKGIYIDGLDFTYTLAGVSVRLTVGTTIDTYTPKDTVFFKGTFSTPIKNRWYRINMTSAFKRQLDAASNTAELDYCYSEYSSFTSSAATATATGNIAICEFELPIVVFKSFLNAIPSSSGSSSVALLGSHSRLSNRVQNPNLQLPQWDVLYTLEKILMDI